MNKKLYLKCWAIIYCSALFLYLRINLVVQTKSALLSNVTDSTILLLLLLLPLPVILRYEIIKSFRQMTDALHFPIADSVFHLTDIQNINYNISIFTKTDNAEFFFFMFNKY